MSFDKMIGQSAFARAYTRYADDSIILGTDQQALEVFSETCTEFLGKTGFACRYQVRRLYGFEALGKRFFDSATSLRRSTRSRADRKVSLRTQEFIAGNISAMKFNATVASLAGLTDDRRWTEAVRAIILEQMRYEP